MSLARRTLGGIQALVSTALDEAGFVAAFTERTGGVSAGPFESLNLGLRAGDDPHRAKENRRRVCRALGIEAFACGRQAHGTSAALIGPAEADAGFEDPRLAPAATDILVVDHPGVAVAVLTADCVPVALADPEEGRLAVVHAGWRGIAAGILPAALRLFRRPAALRAAIGPAVRADHYEVGEDVARAVASGSGAGARATRPGGRLALDLPATIEGVLTRFGVRQIERSEECTACEAARFFSHRRDGITGRQALVAFRRA
jgi:YfiH family protein